MDALADASGLIAALAFRSSRLDMAGSEHRLIAIGFAEFSALTYLQFNQVKNLEAVMRGQRTALAGVTTVSTLIVATLQYVGQGHGMLLELGLFTLTWTAVLAASRLAYPLYRSRRTTLVIGSPAFSRELEAVPGHRVVRLDEQPVDFAGFDIVASDRPKRTRWHGCNG